MNSIKGLFLAIFILIPGLAIGWQQTGDEGFELEENIFKAIEKIDYMSLILNLDSGTSIDTVNKEGVTPLMLAAKIGNPRILKIVLSHKPEINKRDNEGRTALMIAAESGLAPVVETLLRHGAVTGYADRDGNTALTLASKFGHDEVVGLIKSQRAKPILAK